MSHSCLELQEPSWPFFGMCTKYAEIVIALNYREPDATGTMRGGAMYVLKNGLKMPWLGTVFALLTSLAAFGIGNMVQANSVAAALLDTFQIPTHITGIVLMVVTAAVILGGIKRIGQFTEHLVPFMAMLGPTTAASWPGSIAKVMSCSASVRSVVIV